MMFGNFFGSISYEEDKWSLKTSCFSSNSVLDNLIFNFMIQQRKPAWFDNFIAYMNKISVVLSV